MLSNPVNGKGARDFFSVWWNSCDFCDCDSVNIGYLKFQVFIKITSLTFLLVGAFPSSYHNSGCKMAGHVITQPKPQIEERRSDAGQRRWRKCSVFTYLRLQPHLISCKWLNLGLIIIEINRRRYWQFAVCQQTQRHGWYSWKEINRSSPTIDKQRRAGATDLLYATMSLLLHRARQRASAIDIYFSYFITNSVHRRCSTCIITIRARI